MILRKDYILQGQRNAKNSLFPSSLRNFCMLNFCFCFGGVWSLITSIEFGKYFYYVGFTESYVHVE